MDWRSLVLALSPAIAAAAYLAPLAYVAYKEHKIPVEKIEKYVIPAAYIALSKMLS